MTQPPPVTSWRRPPEELAAVDVTDNTTTDQRPPCTHAPPKAFPILEKAPPTLCQCPQICTAPFRPPARTDALHAPLCVRLPGLSPPFPGSRWLLGAVRYCAGSAGLPPRRPCPVLLRCASRRPPRAFWSGRPPSLAVAAASWVSTRSEYPVRGRVPLVSTPTRS